MSLKSFLAARVSARLTDQTRLARGHAKAEQKRSGKSAPRVVEYFHDAGDPYSHLVAQLLPDFIARYNVVVRPHLVGPPPDWAAPDRERLVSYSRTDAKTLAVQAGLSFQGAGQQPQPDRLHKAEQALAAAIVDGTFVNTAARIGHALWAGGEIPQSAPVDVQSMKQAADTLRADLGHYLGATFHYQGEWFWGIDRLHYLEERLVGTGARRSTATAGPLFAPPQVLTRTRVERAPIDLHYYLSFRSPYTYIAAERVKALADAYGAKLKLRFVLPMVMRGMQVPRTKGMYILKDTAREAARLGIPFGKVADPVGKPVERGYSILPWAIAEGRGFEFALSFMKGVWADGVDAGTDKGLQLLVERAGLDWSVAKLQLGPDDWRRIAEANRAEMMSLGLWGVPSFRVGKVASWGQDRLWLIEDALRQAGNGEN